MSTFRELIAEDKNDKMIKELVKLKGKEKEALDYYFQKVWPDLYKENLDVTGRLNKIKRSGEIAGLYQDFILNKKVKNS